MSSVPLPCGLRAVTHDDRAQPRRRSRELYLSVAGITIGVGCDDPRKELRVAGAAARFLVESAKPDVRLRVASRELSLDVAGDKLFDAGRLWQLYRNDDRVVFRFCSPAFGAVPYKIARLRPDLAEGEVCFHAPYFDADRLLYPLEYPLDELLVINLLAQGRGVELHGCGIVDRCGAGYLFAGPSGAGKTTMASLWTAADDRVTVLSDDRVVLRKFNRRIWMYGTPWHGDAPLASPARVPLRRIFFLRHSQRCEAVPVGRTAAVTRLFACCFPTFHNPGGLEFTLSLLDAVTKAVPCQELQFTPDGAVLDFVRRENV